MHIGMWIRIVGQLCETNQQHGAGLSLSWKTDWHFEDMILDKNMRENISIYWPHLHVIPGLGEQLLLQISASIVQFENAFDHFPQGHPML